MNFTPSQQIIIGQAIYYKPQYILFFKIKSILYFKIHYYQYYLKCYLVLFMYFKHI